MAERVDGLEGEHHAHVGEDQNQFAALRADIANLGEKLGKRITDLGENLQAQINQFTLDKAYEKGRTEGFTEAKAAVPKAPWWVRFLVGLAATVGVAIFTGMATTIWNLEQEKIAALQRQPTAPVTVNTTPPAAIVSPTLPAPP